MALDLSNLCFCGKNGDKIDHTREDQNYDWIADSSAFAAFFSFLRRLRSRLASSSSSPAISFALAFFSFFRFFFSSSSASPSATTTEVSTLVASDFRFRFLSLDLSEDPTSAVPGCSTATADATGGATATGAATNCPVDCWRKDVRRVGKYISRDTSYLPLPVTIGFAPFYWSNAFDLL